MADPSTANANANVHLHCHCMADKPPTEPDIPRGVQVPKCLVLEYQGQCVLVARPPQFQPHQPGNVNRYSIKTIVDRAREAFNLPQYAQELSFYTRKLRQCYGRKVKIGDTAWAQIEATKEIEHLFVEVEGSSLAADEPPEEVVPQGHLRPDL
ncbi:hypothetical protein FA13DRAFT_1741209 [Coprinellus micaceus]|uniref:Uncharacterized protein n=1 Tax=Coprinellus micaceus TaxID=71717 RepID=A0A4Y7SLK7_COPMI|nr:hypothetical protein FA13DRAFT_1741209 [Coprinellus micaceus]